MTLTAPTPLNASLAAFLDADIPFLLVVAMFFLVFAVGHATGRVETHVRESERRASQARHPSTRPQRLAERPFRAMTDSELDDFGRRFSESLRAQLPTTLATLDDRPHPMLLKHEKRLVCGQPARTNLGTVRCLARPGHPGRCS